MNDGRKDDSEKRERWDLVPTRAMRAVVRVLTFGANKYGAWNYKMVPEARRRYYAACLRHLTAWWEGEKTDPDTGESHLAHAICCALFLASFESGDVESERST